MSEYALNYERPFEPPLPDPLAFFLTWTTYGTWLPGDERGWIDYGEGFQLPDPILKLEAAARMTENACTLDQEQRSLVEKTITDHCRIRGWELHAVNCRSNHVHVVVSADRNPKDVRDQFKAWGTRKLKDLEQIRQGKRLLSRSNSRKYSSASKIRQKWWTERGSLRFLNDETSLAAAIQYVQDCQ